MSRLNELAVFWLSRHDRTLAEWPGTVNPQHGMQEVSGSIPLGSTNSRHHHRYSSAAARWAGIGGAKRP